MAKTVLQSFNEFNSEVVNLVSIRTQKANSSRDWLLDQLIKLEDKDDLNFPLGFEERHIKFGSFARKTKIRELDDVDLMFCLTANGATYTVDSGKYIINTTNAGERLRGLSESGILNSKQVVNKVKSSLSKIEQYNSAELHSRKEAVTLNLLSYEWVFDIVPCFYTDTEFYLIPDGDGNWKLTDPRIDQEVVTKVNQNNNGQALQLIRTLKFWNRHNSSITISSYLFEQIVINFINNRAFNNQTIDIDISNFFLYLSQFIFRPVVDPKGMQGDLNTLSSKERLSISDKANWANRKSQIATSSLQISEEGSVNTWREIFGSKFPSYG